MDEKQKVNPTFSPLRRGFLVIFPIFFAVAVVFGLVRGHEVFSMAFLREKALETGFGAIVFVLLASARKV